VKKRTHYFNFPLSTFVFPLLTLLSFFMTTPIIL